eukprot:CAMPEP_0174260110 /NCGR_PEP_ID=MMETSP0439-20130205/8849_1 /TAXON_ID=0 /ORGANISM="Stereomyxa ramosa, Strain Chinc5" /LENGTH=147 /DNA_ID=CAMNT_0015344277 /DNA_START=21 /DNA_END=461 /DNA_ORIENTATION=-
MLISYTTKSFPREYVPTAICNYAAIVTVDGQEVSLVLWDTVGRGEYSQQRTLSYGKTDVFLVCYSVASQTSLRNVKDKWGPELARHCPGVPLLLVGTKKDLRTNTEVTQRVAGRGQRLVTNGEASQASLRNVKDKWGTEVGTKKDLR